jgi:hypothetical protein
VWLMSNLTPRSPRRRTPLIVALVVLNTLLAGAVLLTLQTDGRGAATTTSDIAYANRSASDNATEVDLLQQVSPFIDAVHTLDMLISDARLDENSAAWVHAHVLSAGQDALIDGGRPAAADAMAGVIEGLMPSTLASEEAAALRQRHRSVGNSDGDRVAAEQLELADLKGYQRYLGTSPSGQAQAWASMKRLGGELPETRCDSVAIPSSDEQADELAADYARNFSYRTVDLLHFSAPEGTPRLSGMWLQVTADALRGRSDEEIAGLLTDVAVAWYDLTLELSTDNTGLPHSAAAAGSWYGVVESRLDGPLTLLPWMDLLLETAGEMRFATPAELAGWSAQVDQRLGLVDATTLEAGYTRGYCAARAGRT